MPKKPKPHELRKRDVRVRLGREPQRKARLLRPERHLFVTEGTKTEPYYLTGLVDLICERHGEEMRQQFEIIGEGDNTLNLLQKAERYQQNGADEYQHVWILYDQDDFPPDSFDNTVKRCDAINKRFQREGRTTRFHAIWSNQCIELWFVLHFDYLQSNVNRKQYREILSRHIGQHYEKTDKKIFKVLYPHLDRGMKHAIKLMDNYPQGAPPSQRAPATNVYRLIAHLREYMN